MESSLWPIHPRPLPDELLSSWMIRLAQANGFKIHSFYAQFFGRERQIWTRDIDHHAPAWLLNGLSAHTGVPAQRIEQLTLRAFETFAFERFNETGVTRWVMPLSVYHRTRRAYGQQFCPVCLAEDEVPYLRRQWRLALTAVCERHAVLLQDRCATCSRPLAPHRADMTRARVRRLGHWPVYRCAYCQALVAGEVLKTTADDVELQRHIANALTEGYVLIDGKPVYSHLYFNGLRLLMAGLNRLREAGRAVNFERASAIDRLGRLREVTELLVRWPEVFLERCASIREPYTVFSRDAADVPWWLASVLRGRLLCNRARLSLPEAQAIAAAASKASGAAHSSAMRAISGRDVSSLLRPSPISEDVADQLIVCLDREIEASKGRQRLLLIRDKVMFLTARYRHLSVPQLLALRAPLRRELDEAANVDDSHAKSDALLRWYLRSVRPELAPCCCSDALFVSAAGTPLRVSAVGMRLGRAVRAANVGCTNLTWHQWAGVRP